jgi:hypothetical protein
VIIHPISTKRTITSPLNIEKLTTYDVGNPSAGLEQAQKCGRVKPVNGIPKYQFHCLILNWLVHLNPNNFLIFIPA